MKSNSLGPYVVGVLCLFLAAVLCAGLRHAEPLGLDFWSLPGIHQEQSKIEQRGEEMEVERQLVLASGTVKRQACQDVIDGRITLSEAAAQYRASGVHPRALTAFPGRTDEE